MQSLFLCMNKMFLAEETKLLLFKGTHKYTAICANNEVFISELFNNRLKIINIE